MKTFIYLSLWILALIGITACSGRTLLAPPKPTEDLHGLSVNEAATLRSLEKVNDYPLYIMHYSGEYNYPRTGLSVPQERDFACSLFVTLPQTGDMLYGRNFDWDFSPALLLYTDPPDGFASVSMVDLTFLGINPDTAASLADLPLEERKALLSAPSMPFDGMNEQGLTIAMAAVPDDGSAPAGYDLSRPTIGSIGIIREVLDHAKSIDEAVALFERYNIDFGGGPPIHYLIADTRGKAVLIELYRGKLIVLPNELPWHLATNHFRCIAKGDGGCPRYHTLSERLTAANGQMDEKAVLQLLSEVAQGSTQWSITYNMNSGDGSLVMGRSYKTVFHFHLDRAKP